MLQHSKTHSSVHTHTHFSSKKLKSEVGTLDHSTEGKNEESMQIDFTDDVTSESNAANERLREGGRKVGGT